MRAALFMIGLGVLSLSACAGPPSSAYVGGAPAAADGAGLGLGADAAGERCTLQSGAVFCGTWQKPSGSVRVAGSGGAADLQAIATASPWRSALDQRFNCAAPVRTTILGGQPAIEMSCTRRIGGWPQVALASAVGGRTYVADGILPTEPVLERAIGVLSGTVAASAAPSLPAGQAEGLLAARLAAQPFGANDIARFQDLMLAGLRANLDESYVPAEQAYRAALAIQRRTLGASDPATAGATMLVALQLANQGRGPEADALFAAAARLAPRSANPTAQARLAHYRGLALLDENKPADALADLQAAENGYAALLPPGVLEARAPAATAGAPRAGAGLPIDPDEQAALIGVIETRRYEAICLRALGRVDEARARIGAAIALANANGLQQRNLAARLFRTEAEIDERLVPGSGGGDLGRASRDFVLAQPGSRPLAQTDLLRAAQALGRGERARSIGFCRSAMTLLDELKAGTSAELISPCLDAFAAEADADPVHRQELLAEMFAASQLVQGSVTSQQIALAAARLGTGSRDPAVAAAIRRQQDAGLALADLQRARDVGGDAAAGGGDPAASAALARRIDTAQAALADADAVLQAAAPNYGELVAGAVSAKALFASLEPGEAFVSVVLTPTGGWVFALANGRIDAARTGADAHAMSALTRRIRDSVEPGPNGLRPFDVAASRAVYDDTIGRVAGAVGSASSLVVAPAGPLLTVPFELLLTGPADPASLGQAPFLVRRFAISHVPAPANFVSLRRASTAGRATEALVRLRRLQAGDAQAGGGHVPVGGLRRQRAAVCGPAAVAVRRQGARRGAGAAGRLGG